MKKPFYILAFETSCDETSVSVSEYGKVISNVVHSQDMHEKYGGVVPEVASRAHMEKIVPVYKEALRQAGIALDDIGAIAYTRTPGLIGSLLVGATFAKTLAQSRNLPLIDIDHLEAHAIANAIDQENFKLPHLSLIVSGGHTEFRILHSLSKTEVIGRTLDDAVGEAFDKIAKMLNLGYPGGPQIDKWAKIGNPKAFSFPISEVPGLDFSFSGIKTSVLYFLQKEVAKNPNFIEENLADLCASIQYTLIQSLLLKYPQAIENTGIGDISIAGGVSANNELRRAFQHMAEEENCNYHIPDFSYCTDNAGMIAFAAYQKWLTSEFDTNYQAIPEARSSV